MNREFHSKYRAAPEFDMVVTRAVVGTPVQIETITNSEPRNLASTPSKPMRIWVDADACPAAIKEILYRTAKRLQVELILVANASMHIPKSDLIRLMTVPHGADIADHKIVELMEPGEIVITGDIPLAARVVEKEGVAIGTRGELYDDDSVHDRLASRNLMEQLRSSGMDTGGPRPQNQKDVQTFANVLDRTLTRLRKRKPDAG